MIDINASDYNAIRAKIIQMFGTGSGSSGYGQVLQSSDVAPGNLITADQWNLLRSDIVNIKLHQDGAVPTLPNISRGLPITYSAASPNFGFDTVLNNAFDNRFNIGTGRSQVSAGTSQSRTGSWTIQSQCVATVNFSNSNDARFFFNSGGKIRFTSSRTGGSSNSQNNAWSNVLTAAGTRSFSGDISLPSHFYKLTTNYNDNIFYTITASTPYSANFYELAAKCNVANNNTGTATSVDFRITWRDNYFDQFPSSPPPGDQVDGTLEIQVSELKATGSLIPTGSFTIASPTYSITSISAS
jgi:hypothetical protein